MQLPEHERQAHREAFKKMSLGEKAEYIFAYYKLELVIALILIVAVGSALKIMLSYREPVLYLAYANVAPGEASDSYLGEAYLEDRGYDPGRYELYRYRGIYLSDEASTSDHQYAYASRLKLLASIDAEQLDLALMNREAYDLLSASGYLLDLAPVLEARPELAGLVADRLQTNVVVIEDNRLEVQLSEADSYEAITEEVANAVEVSDSLGAEGGMTGEVYIGIIGNTPRLDAACDYISYLLEAKDAA